MRQEQQQENDQDAEHTTVNLDVIAPDHFLETEIDERADGDAQRRSQAADQRHHDRLHRIKDVEHVRRIDVVHPRRIDTARGADKAGRQAEGDALVKRGVEPHHVGGGLVLHDAGQAEAKLRHRDGDHHHSGDKQHAPHQVEEERRIGHHACTRRQRNVQPHAAAGEVGGVIDQFAEHLDQRQAGDSEVVAAQAQQSRTEQGRDKK